MAPVLPSAQQVRDASVRLAGLVVRTTLVRSNTLSEYLGGDVWLKCECDQHTGSFKFRGATNVLALMSNAERKKGVVASSAGNHGAGMAAAAKALGIACTVYVPGVSPVAKRDRIAASGAKVDASAPHYDAAEALAKAHAVRTGAVFVNPCLGIDLLAGQGTVALEIVEDLPAVKTIITNVGGGGLCGGMGGFLNEAAPSVTLIGAQSDRTDAMARAMNTNAPADDNHEPTICDGLAGLIDQEMLAQGRASLKRIAVSPESAIESTIAYLWIEEGLKVEGAGAAGVAALLTGTAGSIAFPVVAVISGGNIDADRHATLLRR